MLMARVITSKTIWGFDNTTIFGYKFYCGGNINHSYRDNPTFGKSELDFEWKIDGDKSPIEYSGGLGMSDFMQGVKEGFKVSFRESTAMNFQLFLCINFETN